MYSFYYVSHGNNFCYHHYYNYCHLQQSQWVCLISSSMLLYLTEASSAGQTEAEQPLQDQLAVAVAWNACSLC